MTCASRHTVGERLTSVFGAALLTRACQIIDAANVTRLFVDDQCRLVEVRPVTIIQRTPPVPPPSPIVKVVSTSSIFYVIMPDVHYCACRTFAQSLQAAVYPMVGFEPSSIVRLSPSRRANLLSHSHGRLQCHHLLAVMLADALGAVESREVRWETVNDLLRDMYCLGRAASNANDEAKTQHMQNNSIIRVVIDE